MKSVCVCESNFTFRFEVEIILYRSRILRLASGISAASICYLLVQFEVISRNSECIRFFDSLSILM